MRGVLQRVTEASVSISGKKIASIAHGLVALIGITDGDNDETVEYMLDKIINMRIFEDADGKMNLSLSDVSGGLIIVPNFTLYGDARKGRRPSFANGAKPEVAEQIFNKIEKAAKRLYPEERLGFGIFRSEMLVNIVNDGPVTILLESDRLF